MCVCACVLGCIVCRLVCVYVFMCMGVCSEMNKQLIYEIIFCSSRVNKVFTHLLDTNIVVQRAFLILQRSGSSLQVYNVSF